MSRELLGDACAYMKKSGAEKASYRKIETAFKDEQGRISVVLDTLPLPHSGWEGWINVFPTSETAVGKKPVKQNYSADFEDDIPF